MSAILPELVEARKKHRANRLYISKESLDHISTELENKTTFENTKYVQLFVKCRKNSKISLFKLLKRSRDQLIILEGGPGSGKSFSLMQYGQKVLNHDSNYKRPFQKKVIIYVDLKQLEITDKSVNNDVSSKNRVSSKHRVSPKHIENLN